MYNIIEKFHLVAVIKRVSGVADHEEISLKLCSGKITLHHSAILTSMKLTIIALKASCLSSGATSYFHLVSMMHSLGRRGVTQYQDDRVSNPKGAKFSLPIYISNHSMRSMHICRNHLLRQLCHCKRVHAQGNLLMLVCGYLSIIYGTICPV